MPVSQPMADSGGVAELRRNLPEALCCRRIVGSTLVPVSGPDGYFPCRSPSAADAANLSVNENRSARMSCFVDFNGDHPLSNCPPEPAANLTRPDQLVA